MKISNVLSSLLTTYVAEFGVKKLCHSFSMSPVYVWIEHIFSLKLKEQNFSRAGNLLAPPLPPRQKKKQQQQLVMFPQ